MPASSSAATFGSAILPAGPPQTEDKKTNPLDPTLRHNRTTPYMTKYEKTRLLAQRCLQITMGAPPLIDMKKFGLSFVHSGGHASPEEPALDYLTLATHEMKAGVLPFIVRRRMPDGTYEDWRAGDLLDPKW